MAQRTPTRALTRRQTSPSYQTRQLEAIPVIPSSVAVALYFRRLTSAIAKNGNYQTIPQPRHRTTIVSVPTTRDSSSIASKRFHPSRASERITPLPSLLPPDFPLPPSIIGSCPRTYDRYHTLVTTESEGSASTRRKPHNRTNTRTMSCHKRIYTDSQQRWSNPGPGVIWLDHTNRYDPSCQGQRPNPRRRSSIISC
jgi:hypothetical protein